MSVVIPEELQTEIIQIAHESHPGRVKTIGLVKETMWFPGLDSKVNQILDQCITCQAVVETPIKEPLKMSELPQQPWTQLVTDFYGPLKSGEYLLVVQDTYTRFPVVEIVHSTAATPVIAAMDRIMSLYGVPKELGSDNGPPYQSGDMDKFARYMGYKHNHKIPYAPWANGLAENFMKNLKKLMMVCEIEKKNWRQQLQRFLRAYRASPHKSTGFAPATLMFNGRQYRTRLPSQKQGTSAFHEQVKVNDGRAKATMKLNSDSKSYVKESSIAVGDRVLIKQQKLNKTTPPYNPQPYQVTARNGSQIVARHHNHVVERHANHCKKLKSAFFEREEGGEGMVRQVTVPRQLVVGIETDDEAIGTEDDITEGGTSEGPPAGPTQVEVPVENPETGACAGTQAEPARVEVQEENQEKGARMSPVPGPVSEGAPEEVGSRRLRPRRDLQRPVRYRDSTVTL